MIRRNIHIIRILLIYLIWTLHFNGCEDTFRPEFELYVTSINEVEYLQSDRNSDGTYDITKNWFDQHPQSTAIENITIDCKLENIGWVEILEYHITVTIFYELGDFDIFHQNEFGVQPGYNSNNTVFIDGIRFGPGIEIKCIQVYAGLGWI